MTLGKTANPYKMVISGKTEVRQDALEEYDYLIEKGAIKNFLVLFGYPFTVYFWNNFVRNKDPCIYIETASQHIIKLCQRALKHQSTVYLGYFTDECNFNTVYLDGKIQSVNKRETNRGVQINDQPIQPVKNYRIRIRPKRWVFGEFVGSSARNPDITDSNFNVQRKLYYRGNLFRKAKYVVSPCDNTGKEDIFTYDCDLVHEVETVESKDQNQGET